MRSNKVGHASALLLSSASDSVEDLVQRNDGCGMVYSQRVPFVLTMAYVEMVGCGT